MSQASRTLLESSNPLAEGLEGTRLDQMQGNEDHLKSSLEGKGAERDSTKTRKGTSGRSRESGPWGASLGGGMDTHMQRALPLFILRCRSHVPET